MPVLPEYRLDGKVAFVAGDADGITPAIAIALAESGAKVFIMAPGAPTVETSMLSVAAIGGEALGQFGDPADPERIERGLEAFMPIWGQVDILVNNCRTYLGKSFEDTSTEEWDKVMARNVGAAQKLCSRVGGEMIRQGSGRVVNLISGLSERGLWNSTAFCASQGAVLQLTKALGLEWARKNVRVNAIGLGWMSSDAVSDEEEQKELLTRYIPLRRKSRPEDVAPLVVYLASDACEYITGTTVHVDGGLMAHA